MSDFLFSSLSGKANDLAEALNRTRTGRRPDVSIFSGAWGTLIVSKNHYNGFDVIENQKYICFVIGGPVLNFCDNSFLTASDSTFGTTKILERWVTGEMNWTDDMSGPFITVLMDKENQKLQWVTDLMMFLPVYEHIGKRDVIIGSHVSSVASVIGKRMRHDPASLVDFVLHGVVTYPFTIYEGIRQSTPATVHSIHCNTGSQRSAIRHEYWNPQEEPLETDFEATVLQLRNAVVEYVERLTCGMEEVAQFISAGEDSRVIAGLLPRRLRRNAFIFLDSMNREGRLARCLTHIYGGEFHSVFRGKTHYLDILREASMLIGGGHQYTHAHTLWLEERCGLRGYSAVFGGYLADSLFKGAYARTYGTLEKIPFIREVSRDGETRTRRLRDLGLSRILCEIVDERRCSHIERLRKIRPRSAHEWFALWPATMRATMPNIYCNRRLFREYEPYMCHRAVLISAKCPIRWKLNRRLFQRTFHPFLRPSKWIAHAEGHFPYFPWWINECLRPLRRFQLLFERSRNSEVANEGPWGQGARLLEDPCWLAAVEEVLEIHSCSKNYRIDSCRNLLLGSRLSFSQKCNLLQVLHEAPIGEDYMDVFN